MNNQRMGRECPARRFKAQVRVYCGTAQQLWLTSFTSYSADLSAGGLYLQTASPLDVGAELLLRFTLPGQSKPITCKAEVAWANEKQTPRKPELPPGVGVQFVDLSVENLKEIDKFLEENESEHT